MNDLLCNKNDAKRDKDGFMSVLAGEWLCCGSDLQRCAKVARIDSRAGPPAPSERPLIRRPRKAPRSPREKTTGFGPSPRNSPGRFLTQGVWTDSSRQSPELEDSSLPLMERPSRPSPNWSQKFVEEAAGLAKPMAACHESESPPCIDWVGTFPPLPSVQNGTEEMTETLSDLRVESLHLISDTLVEPDESPEASESELKVSEGRTRVLMASEVGVRSRSDCLARIQTWFQNCGLENTLVAADVRQFGESAMSFAECCQPGDTCALILSGMSAFEIPEEERIEVSGTAGAAILSDFWQSLPRGMTVVIMADSDEIFAGTDFEDIVATKDLKLLVFALAFDEEVSDTSRSSLCNMGMLQAADALSLADGPCKLTCLDFFQEMVEQAEDLAEDLGLPKPKPFLKCLPESSLASNTRWPLSRAPRELAREIGANNMAATQTWIRTGAVPRPELQQLQCQCPEMHRPPRTARSESPPRERAAAEQLAAAGASIASAALAATAAAVVEAGSATVAALVDVQHVRSLGGGNGGNKLSKSLSACEGHGRWLADVPASTNPLEEKEHRPSIEKRRRKSKTVDSVDASSSGRNPRGVRSMRSMPQNFGSLELMLSGGGALKKPTLKAKQPKSTTSPPWGALWGVNQTNGILQNSSISIYIYNFNSFSFSLQRQPRNNKFHCAPIQLQVLATHSRANLKKVWIMAWQQSSTVLIMHLTVAKQKRCQNVKAETSLQEACQLLCVAALISFVSVSCYSDGVGSNHSFLGWR